MLLASSHALPAHLACHHDHWLSASSAGKSLAKGGAAAYVALNGTVPAGLQVKGRLKEVQLHKSGPLGDSILECYNSGSRNVFALGFVPVKGENTVVLLGRDTQPNAPGIRDLNLDLSTWQPLIGEARAGAK